MRSKRTVRDMSKEEILYRLLKKQLGYYRAVLDITEQENHALQGKNGLQTVPSLMKKKKILLSIIEEIDQALAPIKERWLDSKKPEAPFATDVQAQIQELDNTLKKTLDIDAKNQRLFQEKLLALRQSATEPNKTPHNA